MAYTPQQTYVSTKEIGVADTMPVAALTAFDGRPVKVERPPLANTDTITDTAGSMFVSQANGDDSWDGLTATHTTGTSHGAKRTIVAARNAIQAGGTTRRIILLGLGEQGKYRDNAVATTVWSNFPKVKGLRGGRGQQVWLDGSDIETGWAFTAGKGWGKSYTSPWHPNGAKRGGEFGFMDQVWVDGVPLVMTNETNGKIVTRPKIPGTFTVDFGAKMLWLNYDSAWKPGDHTVEVSRRATPAGRQFPSSFALEYLGVWKGGAQGQGDSDAMLNFVNSNQRMDHVTVAFGGNVGVASAAKGGMQWTDCVLTNNALGWHPNTEHGRRTFRCRLWNGNWRYGYDPGPSGSARFAGTKQTFEWDCIDTDWIIENNRENGWWLDLECGAVHPLGSTSYSKSVTRLMHSRIANNSRFGFTDEVSTALQLLDILFIGNGYDGKALSHWNRDNFRWSGVEDVECYCVTSVLAAGVEIQIYDDTRHTVHSTDPLNKPQSMGDSYNGAMQYCLFLRDKPSGNGEPIMKSGNGTVVGGPYKQQTANFKTEQMFASNPWSAGALTIARSGPNMWIDVSPDAKLGGTNDEDAAIFTWATPGTVKKSLAYAKSKGCETGSRYIADRNAAHTKYFPHVGADDQGSWSIHDQTNIGPSALGILNKGGPTLPAWAMNEMGWTTAADVRYGCSSRVPIPVPIGGGSNNPPTATWDTSVTPQSGNVDGTVTFQGNVTDDFDLSVADVKLVIDGSTVPANWITMSGSGATKAVAYDTTALTNGNHTFKIRAKDSDGAIGFSSTITLNVANGSPDTTPPVITTLLPGDASTAGSAVLFGATISEDSGRTVTNAQWGLVDDPPSTQAVTSCVRTGSDVLTSCPASFAFGVGDLVKLAGTGVAAYDSWQLVTAKPSNTTFKFRVAGTPANSTGGTVGTSDFIDNGSGDLALASGTAWRATVDTTAIDNGTYELAVIAANGSGLKGMAHKALSIDNGAVRRTFTPTKNTLGWNVPLLDDADTTKRTEMWTRVAASGGDDPLLVRVDAYWPTAQPTNPSAGAAGKVDVLSPAWLADLDAMLDDAVSANAFVYLNVAYSPDWARPGFEDLPAGLGYGQDDHQPPTRLPASSYPDYANFCWLLVDHCETNYPGTLAGIGVWNEPNIRAFWLQPPSTSSHGASWSPDAFEYSRLVVGAYNAVKQGKVAGRTDRTAYPDVIVNAGVTAPASGSGGGADYGPVEFASVWMSSNDGLHHFDNLDHHPYSLGYGVGTQSWNSWVVLDNLAATLAFFGRDDAEVWASEVGNITRPDNSGTWAGSPSGNGGFPPSGSPAPGAGQWRTNADAVSYTKGAAFVADMINAWRAKPKSGPMVWYELFDRSPNISAAWGVGADFDYFGFYEYGSDRFNGPLKGRLLETWTAFAGGTLNPDVAIVTPMPGQNVSGASVTFAVAVTDGLTGVGIGDTSTVTLQIDGGTPIPMPWFFVNAAVVDTTGLTDGPHSIVVKAVDSDGRIGFSPSWRVYVRNHEIAGDPEGWHEDWAYYVINEASERVAFIGPTVKVTIKPVKNDAGTWEVVAPFTDVCVPYLLADGAGIEATWLGKTVFSGQRGPLLNEWGDGGNTNTITFTGTSHVQLMGNRLADPDPLHALSETRTKASDIRTGKAGEVIRQFFDVNLGQGAIAHRRDPKAHVGTTSSVGLSNTWEGRMQNLLEFARDIANTGGDIVFDVIDGPSASGPLLELRSPVDRSEHVRFSPKLGNVATYKYAVNPPTMNAVYVGDDSTEGSRRFVERTITSSIDEWGRIEGFVSSSASATIGLQNDGDAALVGAKATVEVQITPIGEVMFSRWLADYEIGDTVLVILDDGSEVRAPIEAVEVIRDGDSLTVTPSVGGVILDENLNAFAVPRRLAIRVRELERT